ncbi:hypothetical protein LTR62_006590 [Meristemomyces frigidus]|uniref:Major facilitator superfamily (MFS) profile domain-containing protein n=1 Tax=Meristemomyces frigidus TaxID=1508187 RepID=A0AAN7TCM8_9PEZI|nr:hypothetical protein LTR62_006590 [Meristemomyces frigidus]
MAIPLTAISGEHAKETARVELRRRSSNASSGPATDAETEAKQLHAAHRKIDNRLLFCACLVYTFVAMGGKNVFNAAIMNLRDHHDIRHQLGDLTGVQWSTIMGATNYAFFLFEPWAPVVFKWVGPRRFLVAIMLAWGTISTCQAATQSFVELLLCRMFLGIAECGLVPAFIYHMAFWYPSDKLPLRIAILLITTQVAGILSGLFAVVVRDMDGIQGHSGWRWLFILEGLPVVVLALPCYYLYPTYPENADFLTPEQKQSVKAALPATQPNQDGKYLDWDELKVFLEDSLTYLFFSIQIFFSIGAHSIRVSLPKVILDMGSWSAKVTFLLTIIPFLLSIPALLGVNWASQKKKIGTWSTTISLVSLLCLCFIALLVVPNAVAKYIMLSIIMVAGVCTWPILASERIRTARGTSGTGIAISMTGVWVHLSGILGGYIFLQKLGPGYVISYAICLALLLVGLLIMLATWRVIRQRDEEAEVKAAVETPA